MLQNPFRAGSCGEFNEHLVSGKITCETKQCSLCHSLTGGPGERVEVYFCVNSFSQGTLGLGHIKDKDR